MRKFIHAAVALWLTLGGPAGAQERSAALTTDLTATARAFVDLLVKKEFDAAEGYFDGAMKSALPADKLAETWGALLSQAGAFGRQAGTRMEERDGFKVVVVTCEFERVGVDVRVVFDAGGRVTGLFFAPAQASAEYTPPAYVKREAFHEKEVTVEAGRWALPGTLTLPLGRGPFPAVVLVHGSGPNDRDESVGPNKPFRDLAWGLASKGVAVLRYEKRTRQHAGALASLSRPTVKEEVIDDAVAAVQLLRTAEGVDPKRVFVLGHSLGGTLVPRIGALVQEVAGFVVMAGTARPLEDVILEQMTYIYSLDGTVSAEEQARLEEFRKGAAEVKALKPADADAPTPVLGVPASYWLDLRGYDPAAAAKSLKRPVLVIQGERDYQVTLEDFRRWKAALAGSRGAAFKSYPALNHLFIEGTGKIRPEEYAAPGHVAEVVLNDLAEWIKKDGK